MNYYDTYICTLCTDIKGFSLAQSLRLFLLLPGEHNMLVLEGLHIKSYFILNDNVLVF